MNYFAPKWWVNVMIWLPRTTDNSTYFPQSLEIRGIESRLYIYVYMKILENPPPPPPPGKKGLDIQCRPQIRLIRVFPVCYSNMHFVNSSPHNQHVWIQRGGDRGSGPSLKNHKNIGSLSNTGPEPLKNQASIQCWPSSARQRNAI